MAKRLKNISKRSALMDISIKYNNDNIKFNLYEELMISESKINEEIMNQPSYFGFLSVLAVRLKRVMDDKASVRDRIFGELFSEYKEDIDPNTHRPLSNDVAEAKTLSEPSYIQALKEFSQAEENYGIIKACVDSFTQRSHLIQSLSANIRKESF